MPKTMAEHKNANVMRREAEADLEAEKSRRSDAILADIRRVKMERDARCVYYHYPNKSIVNTNKEIGRLQNIINFESLVDQF